MKKQFWHYMEMVQEEKPKDMTIEKINLENVKAWESVLDPDQKNTDFKFENSNYNVMQKASNKSENEKKIAFEKAKKIYKDLISEKSNSEIIRKIQKAIEEEKILPKTLWSNMKDNKNCSDLLRTWNTEFYNFWEQELL
jgi:hypothetical protein